MLILAFDTTNEKGGVGIFRDAECLASIPNEGKANRYSVSLFEMVEQALALARLELREIELYAVANGPGSFTGIRVGLAAARAWGKAFSRRVRGVSVLLAMVNKQGLGVWGSGGGETSTQGSPMPEWYFPILDARRGEFFLGSFRRNSRAGTLDARGEAENPSALHLIHAGQTDYEQVDGGWVLKPASLQAFVEERLANGASATCLVRAHDRAAIDLCTRLPAPLRWQQVEGPLMDTIADIARKEEQADRPCLDVNLDAYYIRRPDAELNWRD